MKNNLEEYYKNLAQSYSLAFEDYTKSSMALTLIKGIAMDFEFDVMKFIIDQESKGKTDEERKKLKDGAKLKVEDKMERLNILRNCILVFERVIGREQQIKSIVGLKNREITETRLKVKELEEKLHNAEQYIETISE